MSQAIVLGAKGLVESMNSLTTGQAGAMRRFINGNILRENVIEPRCGFWRTSESYGSGNQVSVLADLSPVSLDNTAEYVVLSSVSAAPAVTYLTQVDGTTINGPDGAAAFASMLYPDPGRFLDYNRYDYARGSMYWSSEKGPVKYTSGVDTSVTLHEPSNPMPMPTTASYANYNWLADEYMVAYRFCVTHTDSRGYKARTAPSGSSWLFNRAPVGPGATAAIVRCPLPIGTAVGDVVELYRTLSVSGETDPGDEMFLVYEKVVEASDIAAGEVVIEDYTEETNMGAALYTNATQQSLLKANNVGPASVDIAQFKSCMWYGNCKDRAVLKALLLHGDDNATASASNDWVGIHQTTVAGGGFLAGATNITVTSSTGWEIGMGIGGSTGAFPAEAAVFAFNTRITNIVGNVITIDTAALLGMAAGTTIYAKDVITINGTEFQASTSDSGFDTGTGVGYFAANTIAPPVFQVCPLPVPQFRQRNIIQGLAYSIGLDNALNTTNLWSHALSDSRGAYLVVSTAPLDYSAAIEFDSTSAGSGGGLRSAWAEYGGTTITKTATSVPNRVYYSKPDEPEAVPLLNYFNVGSEYSKILRIVPFTDSLMVFKEDGVWRISGDGPDGWRVDLVSKDHILQSARMATVMNNTCYFWSSKGFYAVNSYGEFTNIGQNISDTGVDSLFTSIPTESTARWYFAQAFPRKNLVCFAYLDGPYTFAALSDNPANQTTRWWLAYSVDTGTWAAWDMREGYTCAMYQQDSSALYLGGTTTDGVSPRVYMDAEANAGEVKSINGFDDGNETVNVTNVTGVTVTIAADTDYVPRIGDIIHSDWQVVSTTSDTVFTVNALGLPTGNRSVRKVIKVVCEYQPIMANGTPMSFAQWQDMVVTMDEIVTGTEQIHTSIGATADWFNNDQDVSVVDSVIDFANTGMPSRAFTHRVRVPKSVAMSGKIYPYVSVAEHSLYFTIKGIAVTYVGMSDRTQRKAFPA